MLRPAQAPTQHVPPSSVGEPCKVLCLKQHDFVSHMVHQTNLRFGSRRVTLTDLFVSDHREQPWRLLLQYSKSNKAVVAGRDGAVCVIRVRKEAAVDDLDRRAL